MGGTSSPGRFAYRPALDGLRAVAVAAVVVFHGYANAPGHLLGSGGFLGVDVFFVLSGYLITSLLLVEVQRDGRIDLRSFWYRRAKRLLPALGVALLLVILYAALEPTQRGGLRADSIFTMLYVQNWHEVWAHTTTQFTPLSHAWSLSIEEQWYLVWPLAFGVAVRWMRHRRGLLLTVVSVLAVASAIEMSVLYRSFDNSRVYYGTDTRAQALLIGAALALVPGSNEPLLSTSARLLAEAFGWVALAFLGYEILRGSQTDQFLYRGGFLLVALAAALVIVAATRADAALQRVLAIKPLVALGLISYGLYLYHRILFAYITPGRVGTSGFALFVLRVLCSLAVAAASYRYLERPVRDGTLKIKHGKFVLPAIFATVIVLVFVSTIPPDRPPTATEVSPLLIARLSQERVAAPPHALRVLVAGESQAFILQQHLGGIYTGHGIQGVAYGLYGCAIAAGDLVAGLRVPTPAGCSSWPRAFGAVVDAYRPDVVALYVGGPEVFDRVVGNHLLKVGTTEWLEMFDRQLDIARAQLTRNGARLVVLTSPCANSYGLSAAFRTIERDSRRLTAVNDALRAYATASGGVVRVADLAGLLCPNGSPLRAEAGKVISTPGAGLTDDGAEVVWEWIATHAVKT